MRPSPSSWLVVLLPFVLALMPARVRAQASKPPPPAPRRFHAVGEAAFGLEGSALGVGLEFGRRFRFAPDLLLAPGGGIATASFLYMLPPGDGRAVGLYAAAGITGVVVACCGVVRAATVRVGMDIPLPVTGIRLEGREVIGTGGQHSGMLLVGLRVP